MSGPSLSTKVDPDPSHRLRRPPLIAFPVEGQPGSYQIDGKLITPETVFSYSKGRLKGKPYMRAYAYVLAESKRLHGALICEMGEHYTTEGDGSVHHRIRRDLHLAKALGLACIGCNAVHGDPSLRSTYQGEGKEREGAGGSIPPQASSLESAKHDPQREAWNELVTKGDAFKELKRMGCETLPLADGEYVLASDLAEIAVSMTIDKTFGKYSSETFMRYEREDRFDTLQMVKEKGRWWVRKRDGQTVPTFQTKAETLDPH